MCTQATSTNNSTILMEKMPKTEQMRKTNLQRLRQLAKAKDI